MESNAKMVLNGANRRCTVVVNIYFVETPQSSIMELFQELFSVSFVQVEIIMQK